MNKFIRLSAAARGVGARVTAPSVPNPTRLRILQVASYCIYSSTWPEKRVCNLDHPILPVSRGVTRTAFFSISASSIGQDARACEPLPSPKFAPNNVVLYQYEACPFCNKVKAFLDYNRIPYKIVEVNPISKKEIKKFDHKKVPILFVDGEKMVESSDIIDKLSHKIHPNKPDVLPDDEEQKWRRWVDNHLVHILSPNIYRTASEALESFDYITKKGNFSVVEKIIAKYGGATAMYFVSKKLKKKHNITDARVELYKAAEKWMDALKDRSFHGGENPNLADLAVFGVLRPIRCLRAGKDMVENTCIGDWFGRMENTVGDSSGSKV